MGNSSCPKPRARRKQTERSEYGSSGFRASVIRAMGAHLAAAQAAPRKCDIPLPADAKR